MNSEKITKYLREAIPLGEHQNPHDERISVRLDVVQAAIAMIEDQNGRLLEAGILVSEAVGEADRIKQADPIPYDDRNKKSLLPRAMANRKYTLRDAKHGGYRLAKTLRKAWEIVDPTTRPFVVENTIRSTDAERP